MAWTTPKTNFNAGDVLTAAEMNAIGENLDAIGAPWTAYTPTWTNLTVGNGINDSAYIVAGKLHIVRVKFTLGSTSSVGTGPEFTLPDGVSVDAAYNRMPFGWAGFFASGGALYLGAVATSPTTAARCRFIVPNTSGGTLAFNTLNATNPITWTTNDVIECQFMFEAA